MPDWCNESKRQLREYAIDIVVAIIVSVFAAVLEFAIPPHERYLVLDDPTLMFPYQTHETVETVWLIVLAVVVPIILLVIMSLYTRRGKEADLIPCLVAFWLAIVVTICLTNISKNFVGRFRPDFYDRCQPDAFGTCMGDPKLVREGRRSFPSGHASLSFCGLGYLSLYFAGRVNLFRFPGQLWKLVLFFIPLVTAAIVALSRVNDYRHHWQDVLVGSALGFGVALLVYLQYYPNLGKRGRGDTLNRSSDGLAMTSTHEPISDSISDNV